jgi:hypothetical protein
VTAFGFLVLAAFSFALKLPHLYSRLTFVIAFLLSLVFVPLSRALVLRLTVCGRGGTSPLSSWATTSARFA